MTDDCEYCRQWNQAHPEAEPRASCDPCAVCQAPGHLKAHPRQPTSLCLCQAHRNELDASGYHFELYHLIYVVIVGIAAIQIYPLVARFWGG